MWATLEYQDLWRLLFYIYTTLLVRKIVITYHFVGFFVLWDMRRSKVNISELHLISFTTICKFSLHPDLIYSSYLVTLIKHFPWLNLKLVSFCDPPCAKNSFIHDDMEESITEFRIVLKHINGTDTPFFRLFAVNSWEWTFIFHFVQWFWSLKFDYWQSKIYGNLLHFIHRRMNWEFDWMISNLWTQ